MAIPKNITLELNEEDMELDEIFHGEPKPLHPDTIHQTLTKPTTQKPKSTTKQNPAKAVKAPAIEPKVEPTPVKDAQWKPVKPDPNDMDRLKASAKSAMLFGGLCLLVFYWQQTGQMAVSASLPSMLVCTALAGLGIGRNMKGNC